MSGITISQRSMNNSELWDEYIRLLVAANDETKTLRQHQDAVCTLRAWLAGVHAATGKCFNGDYYYIELGIDRPMCVGQFLDWKAKEDHCLPCKWCGRYTYNESDECDACEDKS